MGKFGKQCKEYMIDELATRVKQSRSIFVTNYMGLSASELAGIRKELGKISAEYFVVKNSIAKLALDRASVKGISDLIDGGVGIGLAGEDAVGASKVLIDYAKAHDKLKIKGAFLYGSVMTIDRIKTIASLPPRNVLLAQAFAGMKAPITGFAGALNNILRKFVWCVDAIKMSKEPKA